VSPVLTLAVAQIVSLTAAGIANVNVLADDAIDPDVVNDADKLGLGSLLPDLSSPLDSNSTQ